MSKAKLYSLDVTIQATAYIRAKSAAEAQRIAAKHLTTSSLELPGGQHGADAVPVSHESFAVLLSSRSPEVTFSPAMTIVNPKTTGDKVQAAI